MAKRSEGCRASTRRSSSRHDWIDQNSQRLSDFDLEIWRYAEPAWREYRSARAYVDLLRDEGFDVEEGSGDMPTAFLATWGDGGPVIGSYAEYDAVPGNSQQPVPYQAPREGLHPYAAGHTDPHSMLGVGALTGFLAAKAAMEKFGIDGQLRFFGEPAEKVCGSKPVHAAKGYFDDADAFISYHPMNANTTVWETHCGSYWSAVFTFECAEPEAWAVKGESPKDGRERGQLAHRGPHARRHRRPLPDVHPDQVHQGGDVPAHGDLDAQRVHPGRRRRHLRQPAAPLEPDPVFLAGADPGDPGADLPRAGEQRQAGGGERPAAAPTCSG